MASTYHVGRKAWGASRCTDTVTGPPGSQEKRWTSLRRGSCQLRAGGWASGTQRERLELNALPGVILDNCVLGKAKEGSTEVHAHRGIPAVTVILERAKEEAEMSEGESRGRGMHMQPWTRDLWSWPRGCDTTASP